MNVEQQFIRLNKVQEITSLSKSSIYRLISDGDFPKQIQIGKRSVVWVRSDINNWINQKLKTA
jgi:prophage regulatory protein